MLPLTARISLNQVDATTYHAALFIDIQPSDGSAGTTPFPGWDRPEWRSPASQNR